MRKIDAKLEDVSFLKVVLLDGMYTYTEGKARAPKKRAEGRGVF